MLRALQDQGLRNWGQQMLAARALEKLAPSFLRAHIPIVPIKGLALGRWLYADLRERGLRDIDLLVLPEQLPEVRDLVKDAGWPVSEDRPSVGEITCKVEGVTVELHSALCFPDFTGTEVQDVLGRAASETDTFGVPVQRIDDLDHFILLAASVVKDHFHYANAHQARDIALLWRRVAPRSQELVSRLQQCGFTTGMHAACAFVASRGHEELLTLARTLRPLQRTVQGRMLAMLRKRPLPRPIAAATICWTNDHFWTRARCLARLPQRARDAAG